MFRFTPGRATVLSIVGLAVVLAGFNVWHRHATTGRIHEQWGTEAMLRIAEAPRAELWELAEVAEGTAHAVDEERVTIGRYTYRIERRGDLIAARGFIHLRNSLGQDASYNFADDLGPPTEWRWAIAFLDDDGANGSEKTVVLFDREVKWAATAGPPEAVHAIELSGKMAAGIKTFLDEQRAASGRDQKAP